MPVDVWLEDDSLSQADAADLLLADNTYFLRYVDIYESDGTTPYALDVPITEGSVNIDQQRAERRTADLTLYDEDGDYPIRAGELWYDKVFKIRMGVVDPNASGIAEITSEGLRLPGVTANHATTPDSASLDITGDIEIRFGANMGNNWDFTGVTTVGPNKRTGGTDIAYYVSFNEGGTIRFHWKESGGTERQAVATQSMSAAGAPTKLEMAIRLDVNNGASDHEVSFWWRNPGGDDTDWTQVGATTDAGTSAVTDIIASTDDVSVGSVAAGAGSTYNVDERVVQWCEIWDGLKADGGTLVASPRFNEQDVGTTSFQDAQFNTWTIQQSGLPAGRNRLWMLGTFLADSIEQNSESAAKKITLRDYSKKLLTSKFGLATGFTENDPIENVIDTIAAAGGVVDRDLPLTGYSLAEDTFFDGDTTRWDACYEIATSFGYDLFFTPKGVLTMEPFADPYTDAPVFSFKTGPIYGNTVSIGRRINDTRIRNHIVVVGEQLDGVPVWGEATNTEPTSPTNVDSIGYRTERVKSAYITTDAQAQVLAEAILNTSALESYEVSLESLLFPYLDVNKTVELEDPDRFGDIPRIYVPTNAGGTNANRIDSGTSTDFTSYNGDTLTLYLRMNLYKLTQTSGPDGWSVPNTELYMYGSSGSTPRFEVMEDNPSYLAFIMYTSEFYLYRVESRVPTATLNLGDQLVWFRASMEQDGTPAMHYSTEPVDQWEDVVFWRDLGAVQTSASTGAGWFGSSVSPCLFHRNRGSSEDADGAGEIAFAELWAGSTRLHRFNAYDVDEADVVDAGTHTDPITNEVWTFDIAGDNMRYEGTTATGDPVEYLLSNLTIPLDLTAMSGTLRRVTLVG